MTDSPKENKKHINCKIFGDETRDFALSNWIYQTYAKPVGLMRHEFFIHYDPYLAWNNHLVDTMLGAGVTIQMFTRWGPQTPNEFKLSLKRLFSEPKIKQLLRTRQGTALVRRSDAVKLYTSAYTFIDLPEPKFTGRSSKGAKLYEYSVTSIMSIKIKDKHSRREVIIEVENGDSFTALKEATRRLYGEEME